jgi:hypothetical protein
MALLSFARLDHRVAVAYGFAYARAPTDNYLPAAKGLESRQAHQNSPGTSSPSLPSGLRGTELDEEGRART